jgi:hypothetical protein
LQTVIGTAVAPLVIKAVNEIKKAVDGLLLLVHQVTNEFQYWGKQKIPLGPFESWVVGIKNGLKSIQDYIDKSPGLRVVIGGMMGGGFGALSALGSAPAAKAPAVDRAGLLKSAEEIAKKNAETEAANIKLETDKKIAKVNLLGGVANFPLIVAGVYLADVEGALWGMGVAMGLSWFLNHLALRSEARKFGVPFELKGCTQESQVLCRFSLPAMLSGVMLSPVNWICFSFLVNQTNGYQEMGMFNAANQWFVILLFFTHF